MTINKLLDSLRATGRNEWISFAYHNQDLEELGRDLCAVANSALLHNRSHAFLVWGIDPYLASVLGSTFNPHEVMSSGLTFAEHARQHLSNTSALDYFHFRYYGKAVCIAMITLPKLASKLANLETQDAITILYHGFRYHATGELPTSNFRYGNPALLAAQPIHGDSSSISDAEIAAYQQQDQEYVKYIASLSRDDLQALFRDYVHPLLTSYKGHYFIHG